METAAGVILEEIESDKVYRFWWTKRILAGLGVLIIMLGGVMAAWRYEARRLLLADVEAYRGKVAPIIQDAVTSQTIPDQLNASVTIQTALQSLVVPIADRNLFSRFDAAGPLDPPTKAGLERIIAANHNAIQLARLARFQAVGSWGRGAINTTGLLNLTNLLKAQSLLDLMDGNQVSSVETALDMVRLADIRYQSPAFIYGSYYDSMLVASAAQASAAISLQLEVLPNANPTTQPTGLPSKAQIHALIDALLDDTFQRKSFEAGLLGSNLQVGERVLNQQMMSYYRWPTRLAAWFTTPIVEMDGRRQMRQFESFMDAVRANDYQAALAAMGWTQRRAAGPMIGSRPATFANNWSQMRFYESHLQGLAERRAAAVQLAIRLYELDHQGQFPKSLSELVPGYLPNMPADPFAADGQPLKYVITPTPLLYSVSKDGRDDHGASITRTSAMRWAQADGVFWLTPPAPPTTAPANSGN